MSYDLVHHTMENISGIEALNLLSKWERESRPLLILCFGPTLVLSSKRARVLLCLDDSIDLQLSDDTKLRIFFPEATFSSVVKDDVPGEEWQQSVSGAEAGIYIGVLAGNLQWFLFAAKPNAPAVAR